MGLLNSSLQIGRSALLSYEGALRVVGNNISSAASPDYTRLSPRLDPLQGTPIAGELQPGAGVAITEIQRNIDQALEGRIRLAIGSEASANTQRDALVRTESLFDDLNQTGVATRLTEFFNSFDELQNAPEDRAVRDLVVSSGTSVAESIRRLRGQLESMSQDIDGQIMAVTAEGDRIARQIAQLNGEITRSEAGRTAEATGLRDQRDGLLRDLSELFDVTVREQPDGTVNVYVGSETLIQGTEVRGLVGVTQLDGATARTTVRFADTNQQIDIRGGQLEGLLVSRNQNEQIAVLDELAGAIIADVNKIHADGQGLVGFTDVTGSSDVLATDVPLDNPDIGLAFPPTNGSFFVTVLDDLTGTPVTQRIDVNLDGTSNGTTLDSLAADITEQVNHVSATVTSDRRLQLKAEDGYSFAFGYDGQDVREDTSGVLAALGINTFFSGSDARTIAVNETLTNQPSLVAAATAFLPGDGSAAGRIAALDSAVSDRLKGATIPEFYRSISTGLAIQTAATSDQADTASSVLESLRAQRESISGVNLNEEAIELVKFERAFQGASRYISVVDQLLGELVALVR